MKKIKLNISELKVNSFETANPVSKSGTVKGNWDIPFTETCIGISNKPVCIISEEKTCEYSCYGQCGPSWDIRCHYTDQYDCNGELLP